MKIGLSLIKNNIIRGINLIQVLFSFIKKTGEFLSHVSQLPDEFSRGPLTHVNFVTGTQCNFPHAQVAV